MTPRSRRRLRWLWYTVSAFFLVAGAGALAIFTPVARIHDIDVLGARTVDADGARAAVTLGYEHRIFGRAYQVASLFTFDPAKARHHLLAAFPQIADAVVTRVWPHHVAVTIAERSPQGIWCRSSDKDFTCQFFDDQGVRWGSAVPSTGPLLLQVRDERSDESLEKDLLQGILAAVDGVRDLGLRARKVTLPDAEPGGMRISVDKGYELYMDALADMAGQLDTLGVFLTERAKDPAFAPSYIDLRTPGRIYYK